MYFPKLLVEEEFICIVHNEKVQGSEEENVH